MVIRGAPWDQIAIAFGKFQLCSRLHGVLLWRKVIPKVHHVQIWSISRQHVWAYREDQLCTITTSGVFQQCVPVRVIGLKSSFESRDGRCTGLPCPIAQLRKHDLLTVTLLSTRKRGRARIKPDVLASTLLKLKRPAVSKHQALHEYGLQDHPSSERLTNHIIRYPTAPCYLDNTRGRTAESMHLIFLRRS